ncbi:hypothetical protein SAMN04487948_1313 [Halogranum amylolyticum]|uniref:Uncharacterized protein n=1 Tax=Halogranum amylolyticum TaxID=660520 RepID=A0A1H8WIX5_9EURY|nr:hypothetical protein SAMN04487948_1313 [Halogranum amylolyticum]
MSKTQQANDEIHEDQLLNFVVNSLNEEVSLTLAENDKLDVEDIYEVLVGACADETSVSTLCENSKDVPHEYSVLYHLRTRFDLETLEQIGNTSFKKTFSTSPRAGGGPQRPPPAALLWRRRRHGRPLSFPSEAWNDRVPRLRDTLSACKEQTLSWRCCRRSDGAPPAVSSQSFLGSSTALTLTLRPSTLTANSTIASV